MSIAVKFIRYVAAAAETTVHCNAPSHKTPPLCIEIRSALMNSPTAAEQFYHRHGMLSKQQTNYAERRWNFRECSPESCDLIKLILGGEVLSPSSRELAKRPNNLSNN